MLKNRRNKVKPYRSGDFFVFARSHGLSRDQLEIELLAALSMCVADKFDSGELKEHGVTRGDVAHMYNRLLVNCVETDLDFVVKMSGLLKEAAANGIELNLGHLGKPNQN